MIDERPVLLTGATGYIGGRLAPRLLGRGYRVRCLVRSKQKLADREWARDERVEIVEDDLSDVEASAEAMCGCRAAYYLVHSMHAGDDFVERDRELAETFAKAAKEAGVERIIYLGGLGEMGDDLSTHLRSRREVELTLADPGVPVTTLRAAMIIGSGSASFEILRYLVERLPVMVTPRWVRQESQPIGVRDVLSYLVEALACEETAGRTIDIGGPDVLTYRELMRVMADALELRTRLVVPVPVLTPRLSSLWIHLVTPLSSDIARPLAEGLRNRVVCRNDDALKLMPVEPIGVEEAIRYAVERSAVGEVETVWSAAGPIPGDPDWAGGTTFEDERTIEIDADPSRVFASVCKVGGGHGYYAADWLWQVRGVMDRLIGGPGLRRGRRDAETVSYGEALDFWRVVGIVRPRSLRLRAEMKLPGEAMLAFKVEPSGSGSRLTQTALFKPKGLLGLAYWYSVLPLHGVVFKGMMRGIKRSAESESEQPDAPIGAGEVGR